MIINDTIPLIIEDADDPILFLTKDDDRIVPLILEKERLQMRLTQCHLLGLDRSPAHTILTHLIDQVEDALLRCWTAPLN